MLSVAIEFIKTLFSSIIGFILSVIFMFIPSMNFDGSTIYHYVEEELAIDLPENYQIIYESQDELGFDLTQEVIYKYSNEDFDLILARINTAEWIQSETDLLTLNKYFEGDSSLGYYIYVELDDQENTMYYKYADI
ncbi:hypothetical protein KC909_00900 [Candidatus Dojkabacteria bacterium]|uniref:Uncharacterized protein n=1 Tax=Candidatus Dojkabacteria bacterium TaxID=2099670 RepID=A0A955L4R9_9BACT|nr:hypothetical protein [Candidatus Dojkabacteria bacterium]